MKNLTPQQIETARELIYRGNLENHIEELARVLQYAPTEPGAPLSGDDWSNRCSSFPAGFGPAWTKNIYSKIDAVLAKRGTAQPTESLVDHCAKVAEQVAEMPDWKKGSAINERPIASTAQDDWNDQHGHRTEILPLIGGDPVKKEQRVEDALSYKARSAFMSAPDKPWDAVVRVIQQDDYARCDAAITSCYQHGELDTPRSLELILKKIHERMEAKPKALEERIARVVADSLLYRDTSHTVVQDITASVLAELEKEQK
jgi:hypothetical protein